MGAAATRWLHWAAFALAKGRRAHGVEVRALVGGERAIRVVHEALDVIGRTRPGELRRLQRLIARILIMDDRVAAGRFVASYRMVCLSSYWMDERARRLGVPPAVSVAATLVHEGMHARLRELGVSRYEDESTRLREERICHRAAILMVSRLPEGTPLAHALARARAAWTDHLFSNDARRRRALDALAAELANLGPLGKKLARLTLPPPVRPRKRNFQAPRRAREALPSSRPR